MASTLHAGDLPSTHRVVLVADLSGYHRGFRTLSDAEMAAFLHRFYTLCEEVIAQEGGVIIKFLGDAVLAVFNENDSPKAVAAAVTLETYAAALVNEVGIEMRLGANIHQGPVVLAELGTGPSRARDVIGRTVNQTFLLGRGAGIRISERAYRGLPSSERSPWEKNKPPAVYVLGQSAEPYEGLRKSASENAARW